MKRFSPMSAMRFCPARRNKEHKARFERQDEFNPKKRMKLTGAAILVSRDMKVLKAAPGLPSLLQAGQPCG